HFSPFHLMPTRVGSQGFPSASADARLYMTRRLAGHEKPQLWYIPRPLGSSTGLRRAAMLPASVKTPDISQLPHIVEPSSWSWPNPSSCWPAVLTGGFVLSFGSGMSESARPF